LPSEAVELAEAHEERSPPVGVDAVFVTQNEEGRVDVGADDTDLKGEGSRRLVRAVAEVVRGFKDSFELNRALGDAGRSMVATARKERNSKTTMPRMAVMTMRM
jgi:hypothetical protein